MNLPLRACAACGVTIAPRRRDQTACSRHCRDRLNLRAKRQRRREAGLCRVVGCPETAATGRTLCEMHLVEARERLRAATDEDHARQAATARRHYARSVAAHRCPTCGAGTRKTVYCASCRQQQVQSRALPRHRFCAWCGKLFVAGRQDRVFCSAACTSARGMALTYQRRRAAGVCIRCGQPTAPGRTACEAHLAAERERYKMRTRQTGTA